MRKQQGFTHLLLVIFVIIVIAIGAVAYRVYNSSNTAGSSTNGAASASQDKNCKAAYPGLFTSDITELANITLIQTPIRLIGGSNIKTHSFIEVAQKSPVYSPMNATLSGGSNYLETLGDRPVTKVQYILSFNDSCDVSFWIDHLVDVPDRIKSAFPAEPRNDTRGSLLTELEIKAGELIGYTNQEGRARFDFGAVNLKGPETSLTTNPRFKDDPIVKTSDRYRYATCPYNLYDSEKQKLYQALYSPNPDPDQEIIDNICD